MLPPPPPVWDADREHPLHHKPGTGFTPCQGIQQAAICRPQESLPPGGGVGETRAEPAVEPVGGEGNQQDRQAGDPDKRGAHRRVG